MMDFLDILRKKVFLCCTSSSMEDLEDVEEIENDVVEKDLNVTPIAPKCVTAERNMDERRYRGSELRKRQFIEAEEDEDEFILM